MAIFNSYVAGDWNHEWIMTFHSVGNFIITDECP